MPVKRKKVWMTPESKNILKSKAASKGMTLMDYLDDLARKQDKENKGGRDFGFF